MPLSRTLLLAVARCRAGARRRAAAPTPSDDNGIDIVASTNVYADIARAVGGPDVDVTAFIDSPSADPHSYEANSRNILTVTRADIVIENGGGYDDFMDHPARQRQERSRRAQRRRHLGRHRSRQAASSTSTSGTTSPRCRSRRRRSPSDLAELDPDTPTTYAANAAAFNAATCRQLRRRGRADLSEQLAGTPVAITEPVPGYLIDDLGLENLTPPEFSEAIEEGEDVSVGVLDETLRLFSEHQVEALDLQRADDRVRSPSRSSRPPTTPASRSSRVTETMPEGDDYVSWMSDNIDAIAQRVGAAMTTAPRSRRSR